MSDLLKNLGRASIVLLFALGVFLGAYYYFYPGGDGYTPPALADIPFVQITPLESGHSRVVEVPLIQQGMFLVDGTHGNDFTQEELATLVSRVVGRGYSVEIIGDPGFFGAFRIMDERSRLPLLEEKLRLAGSFAVVLPDEPFTRAEVDLVEKFVDKGGRLLLVADPTRFHRIDNLAERFGISFQPGYLYDSTDYEINFQNIKISDFREDQITRDLGSIALYVTAALESTGPALAFTSPTTRSTLTEDRTAFSPLVRGAKDGVVAIGDLTFMIPPRSTVLDNDTLISNLADYLTSGEREFELTDYPYFLRDEVDVLLGRSSLLDAAALLREDLSTFRIGSSIKDVEDVTKDTVFLGLYEDSSDVAQYLEVAGVQVDENLRIPFTTDIQRERTGMILLHTGKERNVLVVLADSQATLRETVRLLGSGLFRQGLLGDFVGVYPNP